MTGGAYPDAIHSIIDAYAAGKRDQAFNAYQYSLPEYGHPARWQSVAF